MKSRMSVKNAKGADIGLQGESFRAIIIVFLLRHETTTERIFSLKISSESKFKGLYKLQELPAGFNV